MLEAWGKKLRFILIFCLTDAIRTDDSGHPVKLAFDKHLAQVSLSLELNVRGRI